MTNDELLGQRVIATNAAGAEYRGQCVSFTLWGLAEVEVESVDIGYGPYTLPRSERMEFGVEQLVPVEATDGGGCDGND